jgi:hypothetical protein
MLRIFYNGFKCFSGVFASVLDAYFKCFICLHTYVASVASGCFKSRLIVVSPSSLFCCLALVSSPSPGAGWASATPLSLFDSGDIRGDAGNDLQTWVSRRPNCPGASKPDKKMHVLLENHIAKKPTFNIKVPSSLSQH